MRPTRLLSQNLRLTLFTRVNCSLCDVVKHTLDQVQKRRPFIYAEVDVMKQKEWTRAYQYEVPVLHIQKPVSAGADPEVLTEAKKLFHRFTQEELEKAMDEVERAN
ncbi:hypothetical protein LOZ53_004370 [Ophidiomyces ophidiicola]|uniref:Uncharacterized protein n=1 Tax=Ophidiomyces ophidiicola TaxID=1387563 RepID=A0ACB8UZ83_9EURO|nr:uncharacterized protein LOZ57_000161 [Ophidiomyces ophidiicola]KAI1908601.1 hypothetical protein LOZ61_005456 [Ophidiomyces ophidiicola]KAI1910546.1 hypothetical protein LOZ64_004926 [Ophidiomyces ophidiicola]KAI1923718.1 hypothetical protein LOZ60_005066 [Ophidiomyces ophidiicola]KAI1953820.1 hypothetical protein LOZ57_000161 [Ophidiomyces ophidiicola]KAI1954770.1 hypothetical protein LOZ62_000547 [Ophidiomyces ophidiicola]